MAWASAAVTVENAESLPENEYLTPPKEWSIQKCKNSHTTMNYIFTVHPEKREQVARLEMLRRGGRCYKSQVSYFSVAIGSVSLFFSGEHMYMA